MKKMHLVVTVMTALVLLLSACSSEKGENERATATAGPATGMTSTVMPATDMTAVIPVTGTGPAHLMVGKNETLGSFLQDENGMTLYMYTKDTPNTSTCYDDTCTASWLPLLTTGDPVALDGIDASKLGTTTRTDGSMQVTYFGWPLYYFAKDATPGDAMGQNMSNLWHVISPTGDQITK